MLLVSPNLVGSHAGLAENSDVARSVIPDDHIELLRCDGERHRGRGILTDQEAETDLVDAGTISQAESFNREDRVCLRQPVCLPDMATCSSQS
jgi:hypothetical protein